MGGSPWRQNPRILAVSSWRFADVSSLRNEEPISPPWKIVNGKCFISLLRCRMAHFQGWSVSFRESFFSPEPLEKSQVNNQRFVPGRCGRSFPQQPSVYGFSAWSTWPLGAAISPHSPSPEQKGCHPFHRGIIWTQNVPPRSSKALLYKLSGSHGL